MLIDIQHISSLMHKTSSHIYMYPNIHLRSCISHYTIMRKEFVENTQLLTIVPDVSGCIVIGVKDNKLTCSYWGPTTKTVLVGGEPNKYDFNFFIEFLPIGAFTFFQIPQDGVLDQQIALERIDKKTYEKLKQAYEESDDINQFIQNVDMIFLNLKKEQDEQVFSLRRKLDIDTNIVENLDTFGYSRRHLQRLFQKQVGCPIKKYVRIQRINQAILYLQNPAISIIEVAHACGYYDQSHFIHDFKAVCSLTPTQYRLTMSSFYNETHKF